MSVIPNSPLFSQQWFGEPPCWGTFQMCVWLWMGDFGLPCSPSFIWAISRSQQLQAFPWNLIARQSHQQLDIPQTPPGWIYFINFGLATTPLELRKLNWSLPNLPAALQAFRSCVLILPTQVEAIQNRDSLPQKEWRMGWNPWGYFLIRGEVQIFIRYWNIFVSAQRISPQKTLVPHNHLQRCGNHSWGQFWEFWGAKGWILKIFGCSGIGNSNIISLSLEWRSLTQFQPRSCRNSITKEPLDGNGTGMLHDCLQVEEWNCQRGGEDLGLWLLQAQRILCKQTGFLGWVESKEPAWNFLEPSGKLPAVGIISMDIEAVGFESLGTHTKITASVHCCNSSAFPGGFILGGCGLGMGITGLLQKNGLL